MQKTIDQMAAVLDDIKGEVRKKVEEILRLCEKYRFLGKRFTFDADRDLSSQVDALLVALTDAILALTNKRAQSVIEEPQDEEDNAVPLAYANRAQFGKTPQERLDEECSRLKWRLEAWAALGAEYNIPTDQLVNDAITYMGNPFANPTFNEAHQSGEFSASVLKDGERNHRKGIATSIIIAMALIAQGYINDAYHSGHLRNLKRKGYTRYKLVRGSSYPCQLCDDACAVPSYPIDEIVAPLHPRCVCYEVPIQ